MTFIRYSVIIKIMKEYELKERQKLILNIKDKDSLRHYLKQLMFAYEGGQLNESRFRALIYAIQVYDNLLKKEG